MGFLESEQAENKQSLNEWREVGESVAAFATANGGAVRIGIGPTYPRNPLVAHAFYRARLIEHWGTGTLRIVQACEAAGLLRPEFKCEMGSFIVRFWKPKVAAETPDLEVFNKRQRKALAYVEERGAITRSDCQQLYCVGERQARKDLEALVVSRQLVHVGKGRATRHVPPGTERKES